MGAFRMRRPWDVVAVVAAVMIAGVAEGREDGARGGMQVRGPDGEVVEMPLTALAVRGRVDGDLADVVVEQTFENPFDERVEAVYVFPLPEAAAVTEMVMRIGDRRIRAVLRERGEARRVYEEARDAGKTASLLEQERPNIFTQSVANIEPGVPVQVRIRYVDPLPFRDGRYHFAFPFVVGPRYVPGAPAGRSGAGMLPDTDRVPDASRITPPVLPEGAAPPYEVDFRMVLAAGTAIRDLESPSHDLVVERPSPTERVISLRPDQRTPDRDIVFSYALAADAPAAGVQSHFDDRGGFFTLRIEPPATPKPDHVQPKELVFVVDMSGSMRGWPLRTCKALMRHAIAGLGPDDTFQVVRFSDAAATLAPRPLPTTPENVARGLAFVDALEGMGGTEMTAGIRAALSPAPDPQRLRIVLFLTDGYIGNDREVLDLVRAEVGAARLFALGVGSSVNRYLLSEMAVAGRGDVFFVGADATEEARAAAVERFYERFRRPVLTDVEIDWGGLSVSDVTPWPPPDVFAGRPLVLAGRYDHPGKGTVVVRGRLGGDPVELRAPVALTGARGERPAIPYLWARRRVAALERTPGDPPRDAILEVALRFGLLTRYTSFVAVEDRVAMDPEVPLHRFAVAVALPHGVSEAGIGAQIAPDHVQPGDPELRVCAGSDVVAATAWFPFDRVQALRRDPADGCWRTRFLVPRDVPEGVHPIVVALEGAGGRVRYEWVAFRVDATAPAFRVEVRTRGDAAFVEVALVEPPACEAAAAPCGVVLPERVKLVRLHLPDGRVLTRRARAADERRWSFRLAAGDLGAGPLRVEVVDVAGNVRVETVSSDPAAGG